MVMEMFPAFSVSASGLDAQRVRMDLASANLANAQTTRGPDGGVFRKLRPIFSAQAVEFGQAMGDAEIELQKVEVSGIFKDQSEPRKVYDPGHPDADARGFVSLPNINLMEEMAEMLLANRAYEANITAFNTSKTMAMSALNLGKI